MSNRKSQKIEVFENGETYNEIKDMSIEQSSMNGPPINQAGTIDLQHDQTIFSNMSKDVQLRQGSVKIARRPTNAPGMQKANFSRRIQPGTSSPDSPRKIGQLKQQSSQSPNQKSKSIFDRKELKVTQDQKLESMCFKEFDQNFQKLHRVRDIKVVDEMQNMTIQKNEMKYRKTATRAIGVDHNVMAKKTVQVEKATRTPEWIAQNERNLPALKRGLVDANAFDIEYEPVGEECGLIEKTKVFTNEELDNLKKANEEVWDPHSKNMVPTPAQEMFDKVIGGTSVPKIQKQLEQELCQKFVAPVVKGRERCFCAELDKEQGKTEEEIKARTQCNCLCYFKKTNKNTHAMVELAQATLPDEGMGDTHQLFVVQKIADYENFVEDERFGDEEELDGVGRNGKLLIRFFALDDDLKLSLVKKIIINDQVNYQFHPNVITTYQVGNEIYFYQIISDRVTEDKQKVLLRSFNLVTRQLQIHDGPDHRCEVPLVAKRGPLLAVCFLKKKDHVTKHNPRQRGGRHITDSDDEVPIQCSLNSQPVLFIYQHMPVEKKLGTVVHIEFRGSEDMSTMLLEKELHLESFSPQSPFAFFDQPKEPHLELERDSIYFEGELFYKYQPKDLDSGPWKIEKPKNAPPGTTMDQIETYANLIKQEESVRNTEQGSNQGTLFYYESNEKELSETIQLQKERQFFQNCVAIFNQLEEWSLVVQQKDSETLRYTISLVRSSVLPPKSDLQLEGQNRLFASIQQQDLEFGFDQHYIQINIPRHLSNVQSYFFDGHNILVQHDGEIHHIREKLKELDIASKFQTPLLKYFYAYESDIIAGNRLKPDFKKKLQERIDNNKMDPFSKQIVHFDGLYLENHELMESKDVLQLGVKSKIDQETLMEIREPFTKEKQKPAIENRDKIKHQSRTFSNLGDPNQSAPPPTKTSTFNVNNDKKDEAALQDEEKVDITDSSQFLVVTEKVLFTHDDRSVRPILLIDTDGDIALETEIAEVYIGLFDFKNMQFSPTKIDNKIMQDVRLTNLVQLDIMFQPCIASFKTVTRQFILCPSSEISYQLIDDKRVKYTQNYQVLIYCSQQSKAMEIQEFQIEWQNTKDSDPVYADIKLLGIKYFMIQLRDAKIKQVEFMPLLGTGDLGQDYEDDLNKIYGTQIMILCEGHDETKFVYEIRQKYQNADHPENQFKYDKQPYTWANSEIYGGKYKAYLFEAQLTPLVLRDYRMFEQEELYQILKETLKVVGNLVPYDATLALSRKSSQRDETNGYGYMSALEILDGQTTISLYCAKPDSIQRALDSVSFAHEKKDMFCMSHLERLCKDDPPLRRFLEEAKNLKYSGLSVEQTKGIDLKPILERLIQLEGQTQSLKILTKHIFQNERTEQAQSMLMRYFGLMVDEGKLQHLPDFIENKYDGTPLAVNLEVPVESSSLEKYGASELSVFPEMYKGSNKKKYDDMLSKMENYDVDCCVNGDIKIDHTYIDFGPLIFQRKLDYLLKKDSDKNLSDIEMTWLQMSEICVDILENDEDIEKKQVIKNLIDYIFEEFSYYFFRSLNILYMFTLGCFIWQILIDADINNNHETVFFCVMVFLTTQLIFFYMEIIEMLHNPYEYLLNPWNKIDVPIFFISIYYVYERMYHLNKNYSPKSARPSIDEDNYVWMIILNGIIIAMGFFKIMFFFRVYDSFGQFVQLMSTVIKDMSIFMLFMFMIILTFSFLFTIVGAEFSNEDYPGLGSQTIYFIQIFRNSMGDLAVPGYEKWIKYIEYQETINNGIDYVLGGYIIIFLIWTLWLFNIVLALIILLNFLIAIISQSYEQVMAQQILNRYKHRCEINRECLIIRGHFQKTYHFNSLIIYSKNMTDAEGNWEGMVSNIKIFMRDQTEIIKEHIIKQTQKVESIIKGENNTLKEHQEKMKVEVRERNAQVKDEIRDKIFNCEKTVQESKRDIDEKVNEYRGQLKEEIQLAQKHTDEKMAIIKRDLGVLKNLLVESIYDIKDNVRVVHDDLKTTGEKHIEIQEMQSSFIEKMKLQQNRINSSRSQSQDSPRKGRHLENKLANTRSQVRNEKANGIDGEDSLMEASSIKKLGGPELEVVQEYRRTNPKKFTRPGMTKNSSAVPGRRLRSKDGLEQSMANTMPDGFSQGIDVTSAAKFDPAIATGEIIIKDQLQITSSVLGKSGSKKPAPFKAGATRSPSRKHSPRKQSPRQKQTSKPQILNVTKAKTQNVSAPPQSKDTQRARKTSPKIKKAKDKKNRDSKDSQKPADEHQEEEQKE